MAQSTLPAAIPTLSVGGRVFTDLANLKVLYGKLTGTGVRYTTLKDALTGASYQVPAGKSFRIYAVSANVIAAAAGAAVEVGYGDTDVGSNAAAAPTNSTANGGNDVIQINATGHVERHARGSLAAQKYPYIAGSTAGTANVNIYVFGYEE